MIIVHHLDDSRSQRVLWLLEELGQPYEIAFHKRDPQTRLAPAALRLVHPLGKSPVIEDGDQVVAESGAIIDLTAADIQLSFVGELAAARFGIAQYRNLDAWVKRFQVRPAYRAALERGGAYSFAS